MCNKLIRLMEQSEIRCLTPRTQLRVLGLFRLCEQRGLNPRLTEREVRSSVGIEMARVSWERLRDALLRLGAIIVVDEVVEFAAEWFDQRIETRVPRPQYPSDKQRRSNPATTPQPLSMHSATTPQMTPQTTPQTIQNDSTSASASHAMQVQCNAVHVDKSTDAVQVQMQCNGLQLLQNAGRLSNNDMEKLLSLGWQQDEIGRAAEIVVEEECNGIRKPVHNVPGLMRGSASRPGLLSEVRAGRMPSGQRSLAIPPPLSIRAQPPSAAPPDWRERPAQNMENISAILSRTREQIGRLEGTG